MATKIANIGFNMKSPGTNAFIALILVMIVLYFLYNVVGFIIAMQDEETRCDYFLWSGMFGYKGIFEQCSRKYFDEYVSRNDLFNNAINNNKTTSVEANAMDDLVDAVEKVDNLEQETRANYGSAQQNILNALSSMLVQTKIHNESVNAIKALDNSSLSNIIRTHRDVQRSIN